MIQVLQNWQEIQEATEKIKDIEKPLHLDIHKNWDHQLLYNAIANLDKQSKLIDLGCGEFCTLDFLAACGFKNLHGIDLKLNTHPENPGYSLYEGNINSTPFVNDEFDIAVSVSVIEHGVDLPSFFAEVSRILKPGGLLFITTDYWQDKIEMDNSIKPFGLEWKIFSQKEIYDLITLAQKYNFTLEQDETLASCLERPITWHNYNYTFISLLLKKAFKRPPFHL